MTYRIGSAKPGKMTFGYAIDYAAEIANDEKEIAWLSSPLCVALASCMESWVAQGTPVADADGAYFAHVLAHNPELRGVAGLSIDDARALLVAFEIEAEPFGAEQPGDYSRGYKLCAQPSPNPWATWGELRTMLEVHPTFPKRGRAEQLKHAKATLARHKRNQAKYT